MPSVEVHGGRVASRLGSTGASSAPSSRRASRPLSRQPWTAVRRERGVADATILRGSSGGSDAALITIFVERVARRIPAVGRPASAISACAGVESGHPVTALAAARSSRSTSSTWDEEAAGSHAAAAYSRAPRTYPLATVRKWCSRRPQECPVSFRSCAVRGRTLRRRPAQCSPK